LYESRIFAQGIISTLVCKLRGYTVGLCHGLLVIPHVRAIVPPKRHLKIDDTVTHPSKLPFIVTRHGS